MLWNNNKKKKIKNAISHSILIIELLETIQEIREINNIPNIMKIFTEAKTHYKIHLKQEIEIIRRDTAKWDINRAVISSGIKYEI